MQPCRHAASLRALHSLHDPADFDSVTLYVYERRTAAYAAGINFNRRGHHEHIQEIEHNAAPGGRAAGFVGRNRAWRLRGRDTAAARLCTAASAPTAGLRATGLRGTGRRADTGQ